MSVRVRGKRIPDAELRLANDPVQIVNIAVVWCIKRMFAEGMHAHQIAARLDDVRDRATARFCDANATGQRVSAEVIGLGSYFDLFAEEDE